MKDRHHVMTLTQPVVMQATAEKGFQFVLTLTLFDISYTAYDMPYIGSFSTKILF